MINLKTQKPAEILLKKLAEGFQGTVSIEVLVSSLKTKRQGVFVLDGGHIVYGGKTLVSPTELAKTIGKKLNVTLIEIALRSSAKKLQNKDSFQELFELLTRYRLLTWEEIEQVIKSQIVLTLEQLVNYSGNIEIKQSLEFDLTYGTEKSGLDWQEIQQELNRRSQKWENLRPAIPDMEAVPRLNSEITTIDSGTTPLSKHCRVWINGKRTLLEIAEQTNKDPLALATEYYDWAKKGWIYWDILPTYDRSSVSTDHDDTDNTNEVERAVILSVDDSPVVQTMIKRAISDRYQLLLASNGTEALKILGSTRKIKLMLLDVTMPDIDGLEICRTIRRFKKFKDLPVIMLTAKDGMIDKFKGQFAGATEYLSKPVDKQQLLSTIQKYIPAQV